MNQAATAGSEMADEAGAVQDMLRQSVTTALGRFYGFDQRSAAHAAPPGESGRAWEAYAELGLFGLGLPEEHGGFGTDLADMAIVAELLGGAMVLEPFRPTMVAARLIASAGSHAQRQAWLPKIVRGEVRAAIAFGRAGPIDAPSGITARPDRTGWRLDGRASLIAGGDTADILILPAKAGDDAGLFLVEAGLAARRGYRCFDWTGAADLDLADIALPAEARLEGGSDALAAAFDEDAALACADTLGAIRAANRLVRDYTHDRHQFGRALDSFQVLQHRMVDMAIEEEMASSLAKAAIAACSAGARGERERAVSAAKVRIGDAARFVGEQVVQLHGGMGLVQEYPAAHLFARLGQFELRHGDRTYHLQRYAAHMF